MSNVVDCPECKTRLRVAEGTRAPFLSCPRCLARVANPQAAVDASASPVAAVPLTCPACTKPVEAVMLFCPHCEEPLREYRNEPVDGTVRRDSRRTSVALIVLAVIGALPLLNLLGIVVMGPCKARCSRFSAAV